VIAATFILGAIAQLGGILLGAAELLGAHQRARDHLDGSAKLHGLVPADGTTGESGDLATLRGALAAAELNRTRVVGALVLLCAGVLITLAAGLAAL
jgi:hypothetical protein